MELDLLNGFVGKTVIHPNQIPIVNEMLRVSTLDYEDAKSILDWDKNTMWLVSGNVQGTRINELNTHCTWSH